MPTAAACPPRAQADGLDRDAMFRQWEPLAMHIAGKLWAKHWVRRLGTLHDVKQEARIGLLKAIDGFNPEKAGAATFMTYAYRSIQRHIERRAQCSGIVRFPIEKQQRPGFVPPKVMQMTEGWNPMPGQVGWRTTAAGCQAVDDEDEGEQVRRLVDRLPAGLRRAVRIRFGLDGKGPRTLREVGVACRQSEHITRKLLAAAMEKLRAQVEDLAVAVG